MRNVEARKAWPCWQAVLLCLVSLCLPATAQERPTYSVREAMVPMRDGVKLYTQIFEPQGLADPCPILMRRTPYEVDPVQGKVQATRLGPSPAFSRAGYVFVRQDVRGQFRSEGEWELLSPLRSDRSDPAAVDESTDTWDTVAWLLENVERHNGRVGIWGISYDGWEAAAAMADAHPALLAVSPQASPSDMFVGDDLHHNGAFRLSYSFAWMAYMAVGRGRAAAGKIGPVLGSDGYEFFRSATSLAWLAEEYFEEEVRGWTDCIEHPDFDGFWERRDLKRHLDDVRPAVLNVAGWFDAEDFRGPLDIYDEVEKNDSEERNFLVVGPWSHGGWRAATGTSGESLGDLHFGEPTASWYQEVVEFPFFEHWLRGGEDPRLPEAFVFETGGNLWHDLDSWPPPEVEQRSLFLGPKGAATFEAPASEAGQTAFVSDPEHPVPYSAAQPVFPGPLYMVEDQRFLEGRDDVLTFQTRPLEEDLVIAGPVPVELYFSTTGTAADWVVKLIDVYPEDSESMAGAQVILTGDIFRARYRNGFAEPSSLEPGKVTALEFELPDRFHRFLAGHRIMVQIHSTWFPLYDRNPQTYTDIYRATPDDFEAHEHRVFHRQGAASRLRLPVYGE